MTTLTTPAGVSEPTLWLDYESTREAHTVVHELAEGGVHVVHRPTSTRALKLALFYTDDQASADAENYLAQGGICQITEPDRPTVALRFVVNGRISRTLDAEYDVWIVTAECQEVPA